MRVSPVRTCNCNYLKKEGASAIDERKKEEAKTTTHHTQMWEKREMSKKLCCGKIMAKKVRSFWSEKVTNSIAISGATKKS